MIQGLPTILIEIFWRLSKYEPPDVEILTNYGLSNASISRALSVNPCAVPSKYIDQAPLL